MTNRRNPKPVSPEDRIRVTPESAEANHLISEGRLPPADSADRLGQPTWPLGSTSSILGLPEADLVAHLKQMPVRAEATSKAGAVEMALRS